jgi:hypothetical protein
LEGHHFVDREAPVGLHQEHLPQPGVFQFEVRESDRRFLVHPMFHSLLDAVQKVARQRNDGGRVVESAYQRLEIAKIR